MNSVKLQDTKLIYRNLMHFYIPTTKDQKETLNNPIYHCINKEYSKNSKMLMKEIEDDRNSWKDIPYSWIWIISIINMNLLPKAIYRISILPIKLPMPSFTEPHGDTKEWNSQSKVENETWSWRNQTPRLQTILQSYSYIRRIWYWHKNRNIDP